MAGALRKPGAALIALLAARFLFGVLYSVIVPLWEAPDEWGHYAFVRYIATEKRLPPPGQKLDVEFDESQQPPLYYFLGGLATTWVDTRDWKQPPTNPYSRTGTGIGGVNMAVHTPEEAFPWRGGALAAHLARLLSVLISTLTVWLTYRIASLVSDGCEWLSLTAAALVAFWPQFLFTGSVVTNDILVVCCAAWVVWALLKVMRGWPPQFRHLMELGLAIGASMLSKYSALGLTFLFPLAIVALGIKAFARRDFSPRFWGFTSMIIALTLGVGGWWYLRNFAASGSPVLRYQLMVKSLLSALQDPGYLGTRLKPVNLADALDYAFVTFTASFGWGNVSADRWVYALFVLILLAGGVGFLAWAVRRSSRARHLGWLAAAMGCVLAPSVYLMFYKGSSYLRGRTILAILPPLAVFLALGLGHWLPQERRRWLPLALGAVLAVVTLAIPFLYILPAYATPPVLPPDKLAELPNPAYVRFGEELEFLGYEYGNNGRYVPGDTLEIHTYWRALRPMEKNYTIRWTITDAAGKRPSVTELYPGWGNYATSLWRPGWIVCDTYRIPLSEKFPSPGIGKVSLAVVDKGAGASLAAVDPEGQFLGFQVSINPFKLTAGADVRAPSADAEYVLGEEILLLEHQLTRQGTWGPLRLELVWQAVTPIRRDYVFFVHGLDESQGTVEQVDIQPKGGAYPTGFWDAGEIVRDTVSIPWPKSRPLKGYSLGIGMYESDTMQRLLTYDTYGRRVLDDMIVLPLE